MYGQRLIQNANYYFFVIKVYKISRKKRVLVCMRQRANGGQKEKIQVHTCTTSKQIELVSRGWSGLVRY